MSPRLGPLRRLLVLLGSALALALVATGCGGMNADSGPRTLTKREYIERANGLQQDAQAVFAKLDGRLAATPAAAKVHVAAFDELIAGYERLRPPGDWRDEHEQMLEALRTMRQSMLVVSRASARSRGAIRAQVALYQDAQGEFQAAVRSINASR